MKRLMSVNAQMTMHPSLRHVPAMYFFSITNVSSPSFPSSNDPSLPAGPAPITMFLIFLISSILSLKIFLNLVSV